MPTTPTEPIGRSYAWHVVNNFVDKWLQEQPDKTIRNLKDWPPHVEKFRIVQIKANETTEITATYMKIERD